MTYADGFGIRTINVKFNDVADAIDGVLSRNYTTAVSGTSTLYIALPTPAWTDYDTAAFLIFVPHVTCGASPSIKVSDLSPKAIKKNGVALSAGDIVANIPTLIIYNGTWFELLSLAETSLIPIYLDKVNNRVGINTPSPSYTFHSSFAGSGIDASIDKFQNGDQGAILQLRKSRGATIGTNTIVQSGDALGEIYFAGANGSSYNSGAAIFATVDQAPGASNDMPGRLTFLTTPNGSGTLVERMRIDSAGFVGIGTTSPGALLHLSSSGDANLIIQSTGGPDNNQGILFRDTTSDWWVGNRYGGGSPNNASFGIGQTASKDSFVIQSDGTTIRAGGPFELNRSNSASPTASGCARYLIDGVTHGAISASTSAAVSIYTGVGTLTERVQINAGQVEIRNDFWVGGTANLGMDNPSAYTYFNGVVGSGSTVQGHPTARINVASSGANANLELIPKGIGRLVCDAVLNQTSGDQPNVVVASGGAIVRSTQNISALKYKKDIEDYAKGLEHVLLLRPVTFAYKEYEPERRHVGLIADEVKSAGIDELVVYKDGEVDSLRYDRIAILLINAIKTLSEEIEALKAKIPT